MKTKVIYIYPDYDGSELNIVEFGKLPIDEKLHIAKNSNDMEIYSLEAFEDAFNMESISDLGFIYFV